MYNPLAEGKYISIDKPYISFGKDVQNKSEMETLKNALATAICGKYEVYY